MTLIAELPTPVLLLDLDRLEANIERMAERTRRLEVTLRPHAKTHKCLEIAHRQLAAGAVGLTVATLEEAATFSHAGVDDLTWAFPVILDRIAEAQALAAKCTLRLTVDSIVAIEALEASRFPFRVWIEVDPGYHRSGVEPEDPALLELGRRLSSSLVLRFEGLLTHAGQTYGGPERRHVLAAAEQGRDALLSAARLLTAHGISVPALSVGSTPGLSVLEDLSGIDEARPGNYVFYDFTQVALGSCRTTDCAVTVLASVVSTAARHSVCDAGALALSKDPGPSWTNPPTLGEVFADHERGRLDPDLRVSGVSQEHGILSQPQPIGRKLRILPNHSCLTVACWDHFTVVRGDRVVDNWRIHRQRGPQRS